MIYVVVYDIKPDDVRVRMANVLGDFGRRVQDSVFECTLREGDLELLMERLRTALASAEAGNVRLYRVCADCLRHSCGLGDLPEVPGKDGAIII